MQYTHSAFSQKKGPFLAYLDLSNEYLMLKIKDDTVDFFKG